MGQICPIYDCPVSHLTPTVDRASMTFKAFQSREAFKKLALIRERARTVADH